MLPPRVDLSNDPPSWSQGFTPPPVTTYDRYVAALAHAAFLEAGERTCSSGLTSDKFAHPPAGARCRWRRAGVPGGVEGGAPCRGHRAVRLHSAPDLISSGPKNPLSVEQVTEVAERYLAAFESLLNAGALEGASDRHGAVRRMRTLTPKVREVREACASALRGWRAKDATLAVSAVEAVRTELLRLAAEVYRTDDTYVSNQEVNRRLADIVPVVATCFAEAHASARAKEDSKRASAPVEEPEGKQGGKRNKRIGECKLGAKCHRNLQFLAGNRKEACPDGSH
jgi:hypothetical protein